MQINFEFDEHRGIESLGVETERLLEKLAARMTISMQRLQEKAREKASVKSSKYPENPKHPNTGALADSIENPRAEIDGGVILGKLDWGRDLPYAEIQEHGGALPVINPLGARKAIGRALGGTRRKVKGAKRVFGSDVLQFMGAEGEFAYSKFAFPGLIPGKHFMEYAFQESIDEIREGLRETLVGYIREVI